MVLSDEIVGMGESIYLNTFMNKVGPDPMYLKDYMCTEKVSVIVSDSLNWITLAICYLNLETHT